MLEDQKAQYEQTICKDSNIETIEEDLVIKLITPIPPES